MLSALNSNFNEKLATDLQTPIKLIKGTDIANLTSVEDFSTLVRTEGTYYIGATNGTVRQVLANLKILPDNTTGVGTVYSIANGTYWYLEWIKMSATKIEKYFSANRSGVFFPSTLL